MPESNKKKSIKKPASVAVQKKEKAYEMPLFKYFQVADPPIHPYSRAYLARQYQGILKKESDWQKEMKSYEEGA